ncbi:MAG: AI-2E family transporter, partial [Candidatus Levyibacteriota bacterium]
MESVEHSVKSLFFKNQFVIVFALIVAGWFIIQIQEILILFFVSYILMAALKPYVRFLTRYKIPRPISVAVVYLAALAAIILLIVPLIPFFSAQIMSLISSFPSYLGGVLKVLRLNIGSAQVQTFLTAQMDTIGANAFAVTGAILGSVFSLVLVFVVSFYLMLDEERVTRELSSLFPKSVRSRVLDVVQQVEETLGAWFRGQVILCLCIG